MNEQSNVLDLDMILPVIDDNSSSILRAIQDNYYISEEHAHDLHKFLWIFTHEIAALYATKVCSFKNQEVEEMLSTVFEGILRNIKEKIRGSE